MSENNTYKDIRYKILIHHHAIAFEEDGIIWVQSFIGQWAEDLSIHFEEIGLLLYKSSSKLMQQDYAIKSKNVSLISLGYSRTGHWLDKVKKLKETCKSIGNNYDLLLIRGITPYQFHVFKNCQIPYKFFLFVGSLKDNKPKIVFRRDKILNWVLHKRRLYELRHISKKAVMLANSPAAIKELEHKYGVNALFCPTNTIKNDDFPEMAVRKFNQQLHLLFCGRVVPDKGIEDLLEGLGILKKKGFAPLLTIVGSVKEDYFAMLKRKSEKLGIAEQIYFKGFITYGIELFSYYKNSDIYILPSWHEGFPHSIWEAAANCVPIITTPVGGIPSLVSDNEVFFVEPHSPTFIADMILKLAKNPDLTAFKVYNAYKLARQYTSEICALTTAKAIQEKMNEQ